MAVYTYFGGMDEVRQAVRREGFARLAAHLGSVKDTRDPVDDLGMLGWEYFLNAVTNPHMYRVMFMGEGVEPSKAAFGAETFETLVAAVERCIRAGRFDEADPVFLATQVWAISHGTVALHLAGMMGLTQALEVFEVSAHNLFRAFGDDPAALERSARKTRRRVEATGATVAS
jgi:AcrR family transcriptional regulator